MLLFPFRRIDPGKLIGLERCHIQKIRQRIEAMPPGYRGKLFDLIGDMACRYDPILNNRYSRNRLHEMAYKYDGPAEMAAIHKSNTCTNLCVQPRDVFSRWAFIY
ncbi:hypothetical protein GJW-30_1_03305 [Variibacter gotjawalensis]|uniref:Uncharacterized protein n=1 Tax=Variibacter gotjawalensis TaxID=1333996 RepID=A0A0S3PXY9_9BRAD|nr:hypothetical protein EV661_0908 [Variibacter gotjawalensis]BAT60755.1 hypothetical protein GJW-30_1_03305 [Variibacter gotjawalensis]